MLVTVKKKIKLPKHVKIIEDSAFSYCEIKIFNIPEETELKSIGKEFLSTSEIESITIPSDIELKDGWCDESDYLNNVNINTFYGGVIDCEDDEVQKLALEVLSILRLF